MVYLEDDFQWVGNNSNFSSKEDCLEVTPICHQCYTPDEEFYQTFQIVIDFIVIFVSSLGLLGNFTSIYILSKPEFTSRFSNLLIMLAYADIRRVPQKNIQGRNQRFYYFCQLSEYEGDQWNNPNILCFLSWKESDEPLQPPQSLHAPPALQSSPTGHCSHHHNPQVCRQRKRMGFGVPEHGYLFLILVFIRIVCSIDRYIVVYYPYIVCQVDGILRTRVEHCSAQRSIPRFRSC